MGKLTLKQQSTPTSDPAADYQNIYFKADGYLYTLDENGVEVQVTGSGSIAAHASSHENGGSDEISVAGLSGELADDQPPKAHALGGSKHTADTLANLNSKISDATLDDSSSSRPPTAHASSHQNGGGDEISVAGLNGVLADEQDAGSLKGDNLVFTSLRNGNRLFYNDGDSEWQNEPLPLMCYKQLIGNDWAPTLAQMEAWGDTYFFNTSISVTSHVGNGTVSYLNGISPTAGDSYTVTDSGTLTAGSVAVTPGDVVYWSGAAWVLAISGTSSGYVPAGIRLQLSTTTALISPYTDGVDDGKVMAFDDTDNTGSEANATITFTLPDPADIDTDGFVRGPLYVGNFSGENRLIVDVDNVTGFSDGLEELHLNGNSEAAQIGGAHGDVAAVWVRISEAHSHLQVRRAATWAASNFSSATALPFDTEDDGGNEFVSYWDSPTNTTRLYAELTGEFHVSGFANINSTGGITWICECWLRKNGTTEIAGTRIRTGNYGNEDQSVALPAVTVELESGDYLEWVFDHSNLTGNLYSAMFSMERSY